MNRSQLVMGAIAALAAAAALVVHPAGGQQPSNDAQPSGVVVEAREDGTLVERTPDGKILRTLQKVAQPRIEYEYQEIVETGPDGNVTRRAVQVPVRTPDGATILLGGVKPADAESQRLLSQEQAAAQESRALSLKAQAGSDEERAEAKNKLREKLDEIFDLQQARRTREIAKIEERLGKLKDTLKKRETAKDSIVDRRLETLTGGVDELGWEESFPTQVLQPNFNPATTPRPVPRYAPTDTYGEPVPVPPVAPPAGVPSTAPPAPVPPAAPAPPTGPRR